MKYREPKIIKDKKYRKLANATFWRIFLIEGSLFFITSLISIISAFELNKLAELKKIYLPTTSLQDFISSFIFIMFFVLIFVSYKKAGKFKEIIYKGFFIITVFWGGMAILGLFLPVFISILTMGILIVLWLELSSVWVHDVLMILGLSGAASFFGLGFTPSAVVALLLIFSIYDFVAVYKTKHMVLMAKEMIDKKVILGFIIPREFKFFKSNIKEVKPGGNFMILGGGDIVFPSLLAVSVVPSGFLKSLIIIIFSLLGTFFGYWLFSSQEEKSPMPALPPVALFAVIGYFISLLFK